MPRDAKKSDLGKKDLTNFSISLADAKALKITKNDLKGIQEIIPNEKYRVRATIGKRLSKVYSGTLLGAIKFKKKLNSDATITTINEYNSLQFSDGVEMYIENLFEREKRNDIDINSVFDNYRKINSYIIDFFGNYKVNEIDSNLVEDFITHLRHTPSSANPNKNLSEQTIANHIKTLNAIFNFWVNKKIIITNPYNDVTNKPKPKRNKKELNYFHIEDAKYAIKCIDKYADIRLKTFLYIIFSLGCRREECCGLRWCDIDFENKEVNFNYARTASVPISFLEEYKNNNKINAKDKNKDYSRVRSKALKSVNSYRTNYLSDVAISSLKKYLTFKKASGIDVQTTDYIFTTYRDGRNVKNYEDIFTEDNRHVDPNKLSTYWRNFKKRYDIKDVDLHRIRHTVANILEKKGVPKKDIAKMLGNTERVLEEYYTHVDTEELKKLRNTIDFQLFNDVEYIDLNIELIVKIINDYPMESLTDEELKKIDLISYAPVNSDNYFNSIKNIKSIILASNNNLGYFIDSDKDSLNIKIETYKKFNADNSIKIQREKNISIKPNVLTF